VPKGFSRRDDRGGNRETIVIQKPDSRSALSVGYYWCARVTTIGLEFATPALLGFGLDRWWKTSPWITVIGAFVGLGLGMSQVLRLAGESSRPIQRPPKISPTGPEEKRDPHDSLP
jgi:ATP synthase protein I